MISVQEILNKSNIKSEIKIESKTTSACENLNSSNKENNNTKNEDEYISFD